MMASVFLARPRFLANHAWAGIHVTGIHIGFFAPVRHRGRAFCFGGQRNGRTHVRGRTLRAADGEQRGAMNLLQTTPLE
jgi:hypothetical protein